MFHSLRTHSQRYASVLLMLFAVQWAAIMVDNIEAPFSPLEQEQHHSERLTEGVVDCEDASDCDHCCQCHNHGSHTTLPAFVYHNTCLTLPDGRVANRPSLYLSLYHPGIHRPPIA